MGGVLVHYQTDVKLGCALSCMAAQTHLTIAKSLRKNCKLERSVCPFKMLMPMPIGHTCVTAIIETSFHDFSVIKKLECYEKGDLNTLPHLQLPSSECLVIILHFLSRDLMCAAIHEWAHPTFTSV